MSSEHLEIAKEHLCNRPSNRGHLPEDKELDQILNGIMTDRFLSFLIDKEDWIYCFLPSLNWWMEMSDLALYGLNPDSGDFRFAPNPALTDHRLQLSLLLNDVMEAFGPARLEFPQYTPESANRQAKTITLLKCYRRYTKEVFKLVEKVWPDIIL